MHRRAHLVTLIVVLGLPVGAHARPITAADDPALVGAQIHGFDGIATVSPTAASFVLGQTLVTIQADATPPGDLVSCNLPEDCQVITYMQAPVTITFDPPVAAVGLSMWYSVGPFGVVVTGANATEVLNDVSLGWQHPDSAFAGAADIGAIASVHLTASDYSTYWDDVRIVEGGAAGTGADVSLQFTAADTRVGPGASFDLDLRAHNLGPGGATSTQIVALLPADTTAVASAPTADVSGLQASFAMGDVADGADADASLQLAAPRTLSCDDTLRTIAVVHHDGGDADPRNNIAVADTVADPARAPAHEDCTTFADDDCDGMANCMDDDCVGTSACPTPITVLDLGQQPFPPNLPWIDVPEDPLDQLREFSDPWNIPVQNNECEVSDNHGGTVHRPAMCCGPTPSIASERPSLAQWLLACTPVDPNFKSAVPATNALGFGTTAAGEVIDYTITYENIGGVAAQDVVVLDVLSDALDDGSLSIQDGGVYDAQTRTLSWTDPLLPPHEPHTVHYAIAVRDDAPVGTRVRNTATIVFQDAVPPSRVDTPPLVHVIPAPDRRVKADLRIAACEPTADDRWAVRVVNAGLAPAYDATARIIDAPAGFSVTDDTCAFAHPEDPQPTALSIVMPWATTAAIDEIAFLAPADVEDPCAALTFEITYYSLDGEQIIVQSQLQDGPGGSGSDGDDGSSGDDGSGEGSGGAAAGDGDGCSCRTDTGSRGLGWLVGLGLLGATRRRRRWS